MRTTFLPFSLPQADFVSPRIVSLPLYPKMTDPDQTDVIEATRAVLAQNLK